MGQEIHHYRRFTGYDDSQGASLFISSAAGGCASSCIFMRSRFPQAIP